ncbi:MAG: iron-sulfur cluster repair di-iron protein [Putridiphycobacter sp.]|nr:iron-sulfur cluster repair di-iron protein [Putridiphycobacter sp.]
MKIITPNSKVSEIVAENYRTAPIFKLHKIDYCCNGNRTIEEVCSQKNISQADLILALQNSLSLRNQDHDFQSWDIGFLSDYIYQNHHKYVEKQIPVLKELLNKIAAVHGKEHPELLTVKQLFFESADELTAHMKKEELILFPYFKKIDSVKKSEAPLPTANKISIETVIKKMHLDHDNEGNRFRKMAELTNDYTPPEDACGSYTVAFKFLNEFEEDLHKHIHLENNILFPKAIALEKKVEKLV